MRATAQAPIMRPEMKILFVMSACPFNGAVMMSDNRVYIREDFAEAGRGAKFVVLFETEGVPAPEIRQTIRID